MHIMMKLKKLTLALLLVGFLFTPVANLLGTNNVGGEHAYAIKKKMSPKTFNKQAAELSKKIKSYKSNQQNLAETLSGNRLLNAENFALVFEDETLGLSDDELLQYYLVLVQKFSDRENSLEELFDQEEIDIISDYMYDINATNKNIDKLKTKIAAYDTKYNSLVKEKKYEEAIKARNDEIKAYSQLSAILNKGIDFEYNLYYDTEDMFAGLQDNSDENSDDYTDEDDYYDDGEDDYSDGYDDGYYNY
jgi:hypothetical protein